MNLRKYQQDAVDSVFKFRQDCPGQSSVIVIPTGGGKTLVMAEIIRRSFSENPNCRGMLISHVKELLEQSHKTCAAVAASTNLPVNNIGVYSAKMKKRQIKPLTIASIQSVHRKADDFGSLDFIMVDEAHLISPNDETMYQRFISSARIRNSKLFVVGLTATPYRLQSGLIFGENKFFNSCCYGIGVKELISEGYLSPLVTRGIGSPDLRKVKIRGGEFLASSLNSAVSNESIVNDGVQEAISKAHGRNSILVFATSIAHGEMILNKLRDLGEKNSCMITGETDTLIRDLRISQFRSKQIRWLVNVSVLTTGFDAPNVDCVVVMRPTMSRGLWYQMVGRGFRLSPGKPDCLVLDFGENAIRLGCIDDIDVDANGIELPPKKYNQCPSCKLVKKVSQIICPSCGYFKPKQEDPKELKVSSTQTEGEIIGLRTAVKEYDIVSSSYTIYRKNPIADPCIKESHETSMGMVISCYRSLKKGLEYPLMKWLREIKAKDLPPNPWLLNKDALQQEEYLISIPSPMTVKAHKNEKGFWTIVQYTFPVKQFS